MQTALIFDMAEIIKLFNDSVEDFLVDYEIGLRKASSRRIEKEFSDYVFDKVIGSVDADRILVEVDDGEYREIKTGRDLIRIVPTRYRLRLLNKFQEAIDKNKNKGGEEK